MNRVSLRRLLLGVTALALGPLVGDPLYRGVAEATSVGEATVQMTDAATTGSGHEPKNDEPGSHPADAEPEDNGAGRQHPPTSVEEEPFQQERPGWEFDTLGSVRGSDKRRGFVSRILLGDCGPVSVTTDREMIALLLH